MDTDHYISLVRSKFISKLRRKTGVDMHKALFQQDGAPPHCSKTSLEFLSRYFQLLNLFHSALTSLGHPTFLILTQSTTKSTPKKIYYNLQILTTLKDNVKREMRHISTEIFGRVIKNAKVRVGIVICEGSWIEHTINYKGQTARHVSTDDQVLKTDH